MEHERFCSWVPLCPQSSSKASENSSFAPLPFIGPSNRPQYPVFLEGKICGSLLFAPVGIVLIFGLGGRGAQPLLCFCASSHFLARAVIVCFRACAFLLLGLLPVVASRFLLVFASALAFLLLCSSASLLVRCSALTLCSRAFRLCICLFSACSCLCSCFPSS